MLKHGNLHNMLKHENLQNVLNQVTRTNRSGFPRRLQTIPLQSVGTILAQAPISIVSVGFLPPPHHQLEVFLQQFVVASPQDHEFPEGCTSYSGRHSQSELLLCGTGSAVFSRSSSDVSAVSSGVSGGHRNVGLRHRCNIVFFVLTFGMVVEAIRAHHPRLDRGPRVCCPASWARRSRSVTCDSCSADCLKIRPPLSTK